MPSTYWIKAFTCLHWIHTRLEYHHEIEYHYETSNASTSTRETIKTHMEVCRDFVHLGIALCHSVIIPARIVVSYLYQPEQIDFHAWFEAFVGGCWYTFDATQPTPRVIKLRSPMGEMRLMLLERLNVDF